MNNDYNPANTTSTRNLAGNVGAAMELLPAADDTRGVLRELVELEDRLASTHKTLEVLHDRLKPALGAEAPRATEKAGAEPVATSALAERIRSMRYGTDNLNEKLRELVTRVDL